MEIKLLGLSRLLAHFGRMKPAIAETLNAGMKEAAFAVERYGKMQITSGPNRAIKTGYLRASIAVASVLPYQAKVVVGAGYGIYVHEGTRYMPPRPFLQAGLKEAVPEIEKIFGKRIKTLIETV